MGWVKRSGGIAFASREKRLQVLWQGSRYSTKKKK